MPAVALHATTRPEALLDPRALQTVQLPPKPIAPIPEPSMPIVAQVQSAPTTQVSETTGDSAKLFIYNHESGNNPGAINANSGACGLGQALPCSKMPCSLSDYACQDAFFTSYMTARYGTWANAESFWQQHSWW